LATLQRELNRKEKALAEAAALLVLQKKVPGAVGGRGQMTSLAQRQNIKYRPQYPRKPFKRLQRHCGADETLLAGRRAVYEAARAQHPHRWSGTVRNWSSIEKVLLNPEKAHPVSEATETTFRWAA
jgi:hypothetical protein